jgi:lipoprotein NlpD
VIRRGGALVAVLLLAGCAGMGSWSDGRLHGNDPRPTREIGDDEHFVRSGDTVYSIAFRNSLDFRELAKWNGIGSNYLIYPGQILRLTPPSGTASAAPPSPPSPPRKVVAADADPRGLKMTPELDKPRTVSAMPAQPGDSVPALTPLPGEIVDPTGFEWTWPTTAPVTKGYAPGDGAKGLDFTGNIGQPVFAAAPGRVVYSGNALKGYGELIIIKHDDIHLSAYGYNRKRYVDEGDVVTVGQVIGEMGVGPENKPLLHFEIRERGKPTDPAALLPAKSPRRVAG